MLFENHFLRQIVILQLFFKGSC